jgi:hypothetical protein
MVYRREPLAAKPASITRGIATVKTNVVETVGAIAAAIITLAMLAVIVQPDSKAAAVIKAGGDAFASAIKAATLK